MKVIHSVEIKDSILPVTGASRQLVVKGDKGACFGVQIIDASTPNKFYDFSTETFSVGSSNLKFLDVELTSHAFSTRVKFPASGSSYKILVHANKHTETEISSELSSNDTMY